MLASFLWSGLGFGEWLAQVLAQTIVAFGFAGLVLPFAWRKLRGLLNPFTPGGAGSAKTKDGREVHEVLEGEEP